ncbi:MAG: GntG family PLP-dependent aldolase [Candidatus Eremiobacterota bacterium]
MIDLFSDTLTRPTLGMRQAMAEAPVGDEQLGEDPSTCALEERVAGLLGFESALFLISATMANAIAVQLFCGAGDELLTAESSHVLCYETGSPAVHARAQGRGIPSQDGTFTGHDLLARARPDMPHCPRPTLVVVENPTNQGGGFPWTREGLEEVRSTARSMGLKLHLDGSRLFNAAEYHGCSAGELARGFDTVTLCFSKGLGAPGGAALALPRSLRDRAVRLKHTMCGAMRQSGILACACQYGLEHHVGRLGEDRFNAARLAEGLATVEGVVVEPNPRRTNMVFFSLSGVDPDRFDQAVRLRDVRFSRPGPNRFRAVTHLDVSSADIEAAVARVSAVIRDLD